MRGDPVTLLAVVAVAGVLCWLIRELRSAERRSQSLFDKAPVACQESDAQGRFTRLNAATCALFECTPEKDLGRLAWELASPGSRDRIRANVERALVSQDPIQPFDCEYVLPGGRKLSLRVFPMAIRDHKGRVARIRWTTLDLTETRKAEQALRESEERYRLLFENIPLGLYRSTPDGKVLMANPAYIKMLGFDSFEEVACLNLDECNGEMYDRSAFKAELERKGEVRGRESALTGKDGKVVIVNESARAIRDDRGRLVCYEGTLEDITERKRSDDMLRASEERYRSLFDCADDVIYSHDLAGRLTALNRAGERLLGYPRYEALGRDIEDVLRPVERDELRDLICSQLAGTSPVPCELTAQTSSGRLVPLEITARLLFEDGRPIGLMGIARDITERKRWEQELWRKNQELEAALAEARAATEAKSRFLANMSHEIRTPMNGIVGMADLLLGSELDGEQRESAEAVRKSADALLQIIGDILDFSKIEAGKMRLRPVEFDPSRLVMEVGRLLRVQARAKGIEFRVSIEPEVPAAAIGDVTRIRQVLLNLTGNAVKFTESGWVEVRLRTTVRGGQPCLSFEVQDTGIGIAPEESGRLFGCFEQLDSSLTRKHGGSGLGLAISRQLVELMHGELTFDSRPGAGSTFCFTLPANFVERKRGPEPAALLPPVTGANGAQSKARILLAEDIDLNRRIALRMLERLGYRADTVDNGRLAVEAVRKEPYDLVFMDVHMPEMDGFTAIREIRKAQGDHRPVVIAMTARAMAGDREQCLEAGMDDYISKPVRLDDIRAVVEKWISPGAAGIR